MKSSPSPALPPAATRCSPPCRQQVARISCSLSACSAARSPCCTQNTLGELTCTGSSTSSVAAMSGGATCSTRELLTSATALCSMASFHSANFLTATS